MSDEKYEYPDQAGYPDGEGTLDEGTGREGTPGGNDAEAEAAEAELGEFAMQDEEDVEGV
jgi:hypothetical protein